MVDIIIPPLGESVSEAVITRWIKNKDDYIKIDEPILELETDKVTLEINAPVSGVLVSILEDLESVVEVGQVVGKVDPSDISNASIEDKESKDIASNNKKDINKSYLSPSADKLSKENSINTDNILGTGKDGRITKNDVISYISSPVKESDSSNHIENKNLIFESDSSDNNTNNISRERRVKMSRLRQRIAERLKYAQNTAAILTTFNEVDMSNIINIRSNNKDNFEKKHNVKLGFMSFFVKSSIMSLNNIPEVNAEIDNNHVVYKDYYDIGVAVGTTNGLVVPILRNANLMSLADIEREIYKLAIKARDGKLSVSDLTGGTFTISNGGVYGSLLSTPILNPPQSGILGMHKIQKRPVVVKDNIVIKPMMYLALSYDHRIIDGKGAVSFLIGVKDSLENPDRMLLEI